MNHKATDHGLRMLYGVHRMLTSKVCLYSIGEGCVTPGKSLPVCNEGSATIRDSSRILMGAIGMRAVSDFIFLLQ